LFEIEQRRRKATLAAEPREILAVPVVALSIVVVRIIVPKPLKLIS
jgi:hypothetical protein